MRFIADLHVHSSFSRATSPRLVPVWLDLWARRKGVSLLGTGDCSHPEWLARLRSDLEEAPEEGFYTLRPEARLAFESGEGRAEWKPSLSPGGAGAVPRFVLSGEISTIYKAGGSTRKVHHVVIIPSFSAAEAFQRKLARVGNIASDGRPILGLDSRDLLELLLECDERSILVPAHIWTPWFSALGAKSGFGSIAECYRDLAPRIGAVETGLSSNPPMNWAVSSLDPYTLVSSSDAHSPENLAREATVIEGDFSYPGLFDALAPDCRNADNLARRPRAEVAGTIEFFPEEGKYHYDGHRACGLSLSPAASRDARGACPACGKPITVGVLHRVQELADRPLIESRPWVPDFAQTRRRPYHSLIPLREIIGEILGLGAGSKKADLAYSGIVSKAGSELSILMDLPPGDADLAACGFLPKGILAEALGRMREGRVILEPGYDGEYGTARVFAPGELSTMVQASALFAEPIRLPPSAPASVALAPIPPACAASIASAGPAAPPPSGRPSALSPEQEEAAGYGISALAATTGFLFPNAPVPCKAALVVAGPGSGKTTLLVERIARLVESGMAPDSILALTFTTKASGELRERLERRLMNPVSRDGSDRACPKAMTFHAFALQVERESAAADSFMMLDEGGREELLSRAAAEAGLGGNIAARLGDYIEARKRLLLLPGEEARAGIVPGPLLPPHGVDASCDPKLDAAYRAYEGQLERTRSRDFDGLLLMLIRRLASEPESLAGIRGDYPVVLVDEYQDVNYAQYALVRLLAPGGGSGGPFAIGDPDQAIYGFRGADPRYIARFMDDYPEARVFRLARSWRCAPAVLKASSRVVGGAEPGDALFPGSMRDTKAIPIVRTEAPSSASEAEWLARRIEAIVGGTSLFSMDSRVVDGNAASGAPEDIAILLRAASLAPQIETALVNHGIPFASIGERPWWSEEPAVPVLAVLRAALDPSRRPILPRELVDISVRAAALFAGNMPGALAALDLVLPLFPPDTRRDAEIREDFGGFSSSPQASALDRFLAMLSGDSPQDAFRPKAGRVTIMTMHASKGLEFPYVFLPCLEEGLVPFTLFDRDQRTSAERRPEEARLLYVAMTRARKRLYLSSSRRRTFMGRQLELPPSSFLGLIGEDLAPLVLDDVPTRPGDRQLPLFQ